MNNKGQTLVLFLLVLPIILLFMTYLIDIGSTLLTKKRIEKVVDSALTYGVKHHEDATLNEDIKKIMMKNSDELKENNIEITIQDNQLYIKVTTDIESKILNRKEQLVIEKKRLID